MNTTEKLQLLLLLLPFFFLRFRRLDRRDGLVGPARLQLLRRDGLVGLARLQLLRLLLRLRLHAFIDLITELLQLCLVRLVLQLRLDFLQAQRERARVASDDHEHRGRGAGERLQRELRRVHALHLLARQLHRLAQHRRLEPQVRAQAEERAYDLRATDERRAVDLLAPAKDIR